MNISPLTVQDIHKSYGSNKVLEGVSFSLMPGEIFGLIGLNGVGKTTLIKIILDLIDHDNGVAKVFDITADKIEARAHLSYLPEKFQPSRYLKGYEYLDLVLSYYGRKLDEQVARDFAVALDLDPTVLSQRVGSYSKGMGQKLGLVGAFMVNSQLYILDEPMSGLDPVARIKLKAQLMKVREAGSTIFFSSHILSDLDEICDRIGVIHDTKLRFVGTPGEFKTIYGQQSLENAFLNSIAA